MIPRIALRVRARRILRRYLDLPASDWLAETPRLAARAVLFGLPLVLAYSATELTPEFSDQGVVTGYVTVLKYPYRWPVIVLCMAMVVSTAYKLVRESAESRLFKSRRFLARSTAGSLKQLQESLRACPGRHGIETIQTGILTIIVDKTKELLQEKRDDVFSANLMIADEAAQLLRLKLFSRRASGRRTIDVRYGDVGAGRAIETGRPVYIEDIRSPDLKRHFREDAPYRSVLSIPIVCDHARLGVVNVDSIHPDGMPMESLADHLEPYVQLLGLSLCVPPATV